MSHTISILFVLFLVLLLSGPAVSDFEFASADFFRVRLAHATEPDALLGPAQATAFQLLPAPGGIAGYWTIPFKGKSLLVVVGLAPVGPGTSRWRAAVASYGGLPQGWTLEAVEQRFPVRQTVTGAASVDRVRLGVVYGPTAYDARIAGRVTALSPTFLQTQQVTITNPRDGLAASVIAVDSRGHRKEMGFVSTDGRDERVLLVVHRPENHPDPYLFVTPCDVLFRHSIEGGPGGAVRWYRAVQKDTPGSFLRRRQAAGVHRFVESIKFFVGVGPVRTASRVGLQYDATEAYARAVLEAFGSLHGPGLVLYHIGWYDASVLERVMLFPNVFDQALPGCARLVAKAAERGIRNVAYTWPGVVSTRSPWFDLSEMREDREGRPCLETCNGETIGNLCWATRVTTGALARLLLDVAIGRVRFDGIYLDALSPAHICHAAHHDHEAGANEQLAGIKRWIAMVEAGFRGHGREPFLAGETPCEALGFHLTGLDISAGPGSGRNLARRSYSGRELPTTHLILCYHALLYQHELARALAEGTRPTVVWPEHDGVFPHRIDTSPTYAPFVSMLRSYCRNWDDRFRTVIDGRMLGGLPEFVTTAIPPVSTLTLLPRGWVENVPAVYHGVFAPEPDTKTRTIALVRWTTPDPFVVGDLALPSSHPLLRPWETVEFGVSRAALELDDTTDYEVLIGRPGDAQLRRVGKLPRTRKAALRVKERIEPAGLRIVTVRPVGS